MDELPVSDDRRDKCQLSKDQRPVSSIYTEEDAFKSCKIISLQEVSFHESGPNDPSGSALKVKTGL